MSIEAKEHDRVESFEVIKNPAAVALGKLGGKKGGRARADSMTAEARRESARKAGVARMKKLTKAQRTEAGRKAVQARWNKARATSQEFSRP